MSHGRSAVAAVLPIVGIVFAVILNLDLQK